MSAVEERDDVADAIETPPATVLFMARRQSLRLTRKARYPVTNPSTGVREGMSLGQSLGFRDGVLRVPKEGIVTASDTLDAGDWEIPADELLGWLRNHKLFGNDQEGFWEVDQMAPAPTAAELDALMKAAVLADVEALEALRDREVAGWNRPAFLEIADGAIVRIEQLIKEARAEALEAVQAADPAHDAVADVAEAPVAADEPQED